MGATCTSCNPKVTSYLDIIKDVFEQSKIRETSQANWIEVVKRKINKFVIKETDWNTFISNNLLTNNPDNKEFIKNFFQTAYKTTPENKHHLLICSVLFLCQKNSQLTKKHFRDYYQLNKLFKEEFRENEDKLYMKKDLCLEFVDYYVNMISLLAVNDFSPLCNNSSDFKTVMTKEFEISNQRYFIENDLMRDVKYVKLPLPEGVTDGGDSEWINLDEFFENKYPILNNDDLVRRKICSYAEMNAKMQNSNVNSNTNANPNSNSNANTNANSNPNTNSSSN